MRTYSITKKQLADLLQISEATLRRDLNHTIYSSIEPLGYRKNSNILKGKVLQFLTEYYCIEVEL